MNTSYTHIKRKRLHILLRALVHVGIVPVAGSSEDAKVARVLILNDVWQEMGEEKH